jgi:hypothetical protein
MTSAVFGHVMSYNLLKIAKVSEETTMFIFHFKDGASEIAVNLCQNTVVVSKTIISSSRCVYWPCDHPVFCPVGFVAGIL